MANADRPGATPGPGRRGGGGGGGGPQRPKRTGWQAFFYWTAVLGVWGVIFMIAFVAAFARGLPDTSRLYDIQRQPSVSYLDRNGALIAMRGSQQAPPADLDKLPAYVPAAFVSIEDRRFYSHFGFDPFGIIRSQIYNATHRGVPLRGGSTITQQLARNLFLTPEQNYKRKVQELMLAVWLEWKFSKKQILALYLNRVNFGAGAYGIEAASQRYFNKSASQLSVGEAAGGPIAYLLMAFFALIFGFGFFTATRDFVRFSFQAQMMGQQQPMNVNEQIIRPLLGFASTIALFLVPMITMRLIAEEKRTGTIELLLTSPVKDIEIILGKWLGAVVLYVCVLGMSMINVAMLFAWGKPDLKPVLVAYLGLILQGACLLAIGTFISTTTKNQIIAGGVTFFVCLLLWLLSWFTAFDSGAASQVVNYISIVTHFENFSKGVLDSKDVVFYCSMIFFALFITSRAMESLRWRS